MSSRHPHKNRTPEHARSSKPHQQGSYEDKPKIVKRNYHVTPQTAYHIRELAFQEDIPEGKVIDKLMRSYLAERNARYQPRYL